MSTHADQNELWFLVSRGGVGRYCGEVSDGPKSAVERACVPYRLSAHSPSIREVAVRGEQY
jgi:hypothetical protein